AHRLRTRRRDGRRRDQEDGRDGDRAGRVVERVLRHAECGDRDGPGGLRPPDRRDLWRTRVAHGRNVVAREPDPAFEHLLDYVRDTGGFDFTGYKRPSLVRRVRKRMHEVGISEFGEYQDHLEVHPDEFTQLFNTILINVTSFFRDAQAWEYLS